MTAAAPSARSLSWLDWVLDFLPTAPAAAPSVPEPPAEIRVLMDIGRDALGARDLADLRLRLDRGIMGVRNIGAIAPPSERVLHSLPEQPREGSMVARALGLNVARKLLRALHTLEPILRAIRSLQGDDPHAALALRALGVRPWSLHDGQVVPHALVASAIVQVRGLVALGALLSACVDARQPEPWLTNALADACLDAVGELARIMASAGIEVGNQPEDLLDLRALFREAEDADAAFVAALERDVTAGQLGVPEDD